MPLNSSRPELAAPTDLNNVAKRYEAISLGPRNSAEQLA